MRLRRDGIDFRLLIVIKCHRGKLAAIPPLVGYSACVTLLSLSAENQQMPDEIWDVFLKYFDKESVTDLKMIDLVISNFHCHDGVVVTWDYNGGPSV